MNKQNLDFEDFDVGDTVVFDRVFRAGDFKRFAALSGDMNPLHWDKSYASETSFAKPIVPMFLAASPFSTIAGMMLPGHRSLILKSEIRSLQPVRYGVGVTYSATITDRHVASRMLDLRIIAFHGALVLMEGRLSVQVRRDAPPDYHADEADLPSDIHKRAQRGLAMVIGASGDIGGAVAQKLARQGWNLLLHGNARAPDQIADVCRKAGAEVETACAALHTVAGRRQLARWIAEAAPQAFIFAASPGIDATSQQLLDVNFAAFKDAIEAAVPAMLAKQQGRIVFVGSAAVRTRPVGWENYVAAKHAGMNLVATYDARYAAYGVRMATVAPGLVDTPFSASFSATGSIALMPEEVAEVIVNEVDSADGCIAECIWQYPGRLDIEGGASAKNEDPKVAKSAENEPSKTLAPQPQRAVDTAGLICNYLGLPQNHDLSDGGLGLTPNWDSLRHIEVLTHLESKLGITFTSQEITAAVRFNDVNDLVVRKLADQ